MNDIAVHVVGTPEVVAHTLASCTDDLIHALEEDLDMVVSRREPLATIGKANTAVAVSHRALASRIMTLLRRFGTLVTRTAKHLGVDFGLGARTRAGISKHSRWSQNAARRARTT